MKRMITSFLIVTLSIVLLIILPFVLKTQQEEYIDFSEVTETVDNSAKDDETLRIGQPQLFFQALKNRAVQE
mgnify:CR=1 FL=1